MGMFLNFGPSPSACGDQVSSVVIGYLSLLPFEQVFIKDTLHTIPDEDEGWKREREKADTKAESLKPKRKLIIKPKERKRAFLPSSHVLLFLPLTISFLSLPPQSPSLRAFPFPFFIFFLNIDFSFTE